MYKVASYPSHPFPAQAHHRSSQKLVFEHDDLTPTSPYAHSTFPQSRASGNVQLPRTLARPPFAEVSWKSVAAVAPELANVPLEYTRRHLRDRAPQMLAGISALSSSHLPSSMSKFQAAQTRSLPVPLRSQTSPHTHTFPTHILALSAASKTVSTPSTAEVQLHPSHALIIATQCANLPPLPTSSASSQPGANGSLNLPVLPLSVPSPSTFAALHYYLYTHNAATLLSSLLPKNCLPPQFLSAISSSHSQVKSTLASGGKLHQLSSSLCKHYNGDLQLLMTQSNVITGVWRNVVSLGISNPDLWDTLDLAWEVLLGALNLAAGV